MDMFYSSRAYMPMMWRKHFLSYRQLVITISKEASDKSQCCAFTLFLSATVSPSQHISKSRGVKSKWKPENNWKEKEAPRFSPWSLTELKAFPKSGANSFGSKTWTGIRLFKLLILLSMNIHSFLCRNNNVLDYRAQTCWGCYIIYQHINYMH